MHPDNGFSKKMSAFPYAIDIGDEIFMMVRTLGTIVTFLGQISDGRRHPFVNLVSTLRHSCVILASPWRHSCVNKLKKYIEFQSCKFGTRKVIGSIKTIVFIGYEDWPTKMNDFRNTRQYFFGFTILYYINLITGLSR